MNSGDMDDVCPITATRYSVKDLHLAVTKPWRPWYTPQSEVTMYIYAVTPMVLASFMIGLYYELDYDHV